MPRTEYWVREIDSEHKSFLGLIVNDDNTVHMSYDLVTRLLQGQGLQKVGEPSGS